MYLSCLGHTVYVILCRVSLENTLDVLTASVNSLSYCALRDGNINIQTKNSFCIKKDDEGREYTSMVYLESTIRTIQDVPKEDVQPAFV